MVNRSRWKGVHDKFPAHVEEAKNSDGNVHRGYSLLEFRIAAELLRIGPIHSADDYWAPSDWQLLLVISEYMSAVLEFLDWFWPDLGWEHHKQAIVLSKRLLQPRSPHTYPELHIDPQLRAAWQAFTYCFWHGTRHLRAAPPPGEPSAAYNAAREWLTKLVGERGFEPDGLIASSLHTWIQSTRPRLQEAFPAVDWSGWPSVMWPDPDCAVRGVEKRGAMKRRQPDDDCAVRWPLRVTQGRPKFNHLKLEARDGFVVGIPPVKNPPALGFLAVSDIMCAFKQAAQHWPSTQPGSPTYLAQQDVVNNFVQNVLRETRGPLAPGIPHENLRYLGFVACSVLGWNTALALLAHPVCETATWGLQSLLLPGGAAAALMHHQHDQQHHHQLQLQQQPQPQQQFQLDSTLHPSSITLGGIESALDPGIHVDLGIAAQLALQPELLMSPETEAALSMRMWPLTVPPLPLSLPPLSAGFSTTAHATPKVAETVASFGSVPLPSPTAAGANAAPSLAGQSSATLSAGTQPPPQPSQTQRLDVKATRPKPSPFLARTCTASSASTASSVEGTQQQQEQHQHEQDHHAVDMPPQKQLLVAELPAREKPNDEHGAVLPGHLALDDLAPMSIGGLSSMQDLIDGLPSQTDLNWSAMLGAATNGEDAGAAAGPGEVASASDLTGALPSLLLPSWLVLKSPPRPGPSQPPPNQLVSLQAQTSRSQQPGCAMVSTPVSPQAAGGMLSYCPLLLQAPPRPAPEAPIHKQLPSPVTSPCQATITTGVLPCSALPSLALPSGGLSRPQLSGTESRSYTRLSHGEVSTLSPMTSCGGNVEVVPCSPAPAGAAAVRVEDEATAVAGASGGGRGGRSIGRECDSREISASNTPVLLTSGSRRTRHDVAVAAAAAAADQGLTPAPGSLVERSAKRPHAQETMQVHPRVSGIIDAASANRVESLDAFLTDEQAGLAAERPTSMHLQMQQVVAEAHATGWATASIGPGDDALEGRQLLQMLRAWAEKAAQVGDVSSQAEDAAEVYRRMEQMLAQGAPVDVVEYDEAVAAAAAPHGVSARLSSAGYTPLHWACLRGDVSLAELLLRHGADPDRRDAAGLTARQVNPGFAGALAEAAERCAAQARAHPRSIICVPVHAKVQGLSSVFALSSGSTAATAVAAAEAVAQQGGLRDRLAQLLQSADEVAAQLAQLDPLAAAGEVLQAIRDTEYLYRCIVSGVAVR